MTYKSVVEVFFSAFFLGGLAHSIPFRPPLWLYPDARQSLENKEYISQPLLRSPLLPLLLLQPARKCLAFPQQRWRGPRWSQAECRASILLVRRVAEVMRPQSQQSRWWLLPFQTTQETAGCGASEWDSGCLIAWWSWQASSACFPGNPFWTLSLEVAPPFLTVYQHWIP